MNRQKTIFATSVLMLALGLGCSRESAVYPDPVSAAVLNPTTDSTALSSDFANQSVNRASVERSSDSVTTASKAIRFETSAGSNVIGGFNGTGTGNRALLGINGWHSRPVAQAEPITFDAKNFKGAENVGTALQIDLNCDSSLIRVVAAAGSNIAAQSHTPAGDGYMRYTASTSASIWLSSLNSILDPDTSAILVPSSGPPVSLNALLAKYPAACLKNAATNAADLPDRVTTNAVLLNLGSDSTIGANSTFVRRITVGSQVFESFE